MPPKTQTRRGRVDSVASGDAASSRKNTEKSKCEKCNKTLSDLTIECESCFNWFHIRCVDLDASDMNTIEKRGIHWFCDKCDHVLNSIDSRFKALETKLETFIDTQESKSDETYASVVSKIEKSEGVLSKHLNDQEKCIKDQEKQIKNLRNDLSTENRAKNVIIFGINEGESSPADTVELVNSMISECSFMFNATKSNTIRLGAKKVDKPRPVRLSLDSEFDKWELLKRINNLKVPGTFARLDLTKEEQNKDFQLRQQLRDVRKQDPRSTYKIQKNQIVKISTD